MFTALNSTLAAVVALYNSVQKHPVYRRMVYPPTPAQLSFYINSIFSRYQALDAPADEAQWPTTVDLDASAGSASKTLPEAAPKHGALYAAGMPEPVSSVVVWRIILDGIMLIGPTVVVTCLLLFFGQWLSGEKLRGPDMCAPENVPTIVISSCEEPESETRQQGDDIFRTLALATAPAEIEDAVHISDQEEQEQEHTDDEDEDNVCQASGQDDDGDLVEQAVSIAAEIPGSISNYDSASENKHAAFLERAFDTEMVPPVDIDARNSFRTDTQNDPAALSLISADLASLVVPSASTGLQDPRQPALDTPISSANSLSEADVDVYFAHIREESAAVLHSMLLGIERKRESSADPFVYSEPAAAPEIPAEAPRSTETVLADVASIPSPVLAEGDPSVDPFVCAEPAMDPETPVEAPGTTETVLADSACILSPTSPEGPPAIGLLPEIPTVKSAKHTDFLEMIFAAETAPANTTQLALEFDNRDLDFLEGEAAFALGLAHSVSIVSESESTELSALACSVEDLSGMRTLVACTCKTHDKAILDKDTTVTKNEVADISALTPLLLPQDIASPLLDLELPSSETPLDSPDFRDALQTSTPNLALLSMEDLLPASIIDELVEALALPTPGFDTSPPVCSLILPEDDIVQPRVCLPISKYLHSHFPPPPPPPRAYGPGDRATTAAYPQTTDYPDEVGGSWATTMVPLTEEVSPPRVCLPGKSTIPSSSPAFRTNDLESATNAAIARAEHLASTPGNFRPETLSFPYIAPGDSIVKVGAPASMVERNTTASPVVAYVQQVNVKAAAKDALERANAMAAERRMIMAHSGISGSNPETAPTFNSPPVSSDAVMAVKDDLRERIQAALADATRLWGAAADNQQAVALGSPVLDVRPVLHSVDRVNAQLEHGRGDTELARQMAATASSLGDAAATNLAVSVIEFASNATNFSLRRDPEHFRTVSGEESTGEADEGVDDDETGVRCGMKRRRKPADPDVYKSAKPWGTQKSIQQAKTQRRRRSGISRLRSMPTVHTLQQPVEYDDDEDL